MREGGELLKTRYRGVQKYSEKERFQLVSETDVEIERLIIDRLRSIHPEDTVVSEESGFGGDNGNVRWIVDPIDGSANFIAGVPYFAISIAREVDGKIVEGYVYNPVADEFYYSTEGADASFLNDDRISVSDTSDIRESLVAFGFSARMEAIDRYYADWGNVFEICRKGLALVVPSLSICNVARGRLDGFIDFGCSTEGQAAASLILANAGGVILDYDLIGYDHRRKGAVASNANLMSFLEEARI